MRENLWSPSYFAASCGGAPQSITKQYIEGQARPL
jgi:putative transposase